MHQTVCANLGEVCVPAEGETSSEADARDVDDGDSHGDGGELVRSQVSAERQTDGLNQVVEQDGQ